MDDLKDKTEERLLLEKIEQNTSVLPRLFSGKGKGLSVAAEVGKSIKKTLIPRFLGGFASKEEGVAKPLATVVKVGKVVADKAINEIEAATKGAAKPEPVPKASTPPVKPIAIEAPGKPEPAKPAAPVTVTVETATPEPVKARIISETAKQVERKPEPVKPIVHVAAAKVVERVKAGRSETPTTAEIARDRNGRFLSAGVKAHGERKQENKNQNEKKTLFQTIKDGFKSAVGFGPEGKNSVVSKSTIEDAAGKAAGGPIWEAVKELCEAVGELRGKAKDDTTTGKILRKIGARFGRKDTATVAVEKTEKAEQKRHRELIQTVQNSRSVVESSGGGNVAQTALEAVGLKRLFGNIPKSGLIGALGTMIKTAFLPLTALAAGFGAILSIINKGNDNGVGYNPTPEQSKALTASPKVPITKDMVPFQGQFNKAAKKYNVDPNLLLAVGHGESGFDPNAVSPKGATGVMQLMPETAKALGVNPHNNNENIMGGAKLISSYLKTYNGDIDKALAAYNWGPGNVAKYGMGKLPAETQNYIKTVKRYYAAYTDIDAKTAQAQNPTQPPTQAQPVAMPPIAISDPIKAATVTQPATRQAVVASIPAKAVQKAEVAPKSVTQPVRLEKPVKQPEAVMPNLDRLEAAILKLGQDKPKRQEKPGPPVIKTGFDDTMLTLIAHDRI